MKSDQKQVQYTLYHITYGKTFHFSQLRFANFTFYIEPFYGPCSSAHQWYTLKGFLFMGNYLRTWFYELWFGACSIFSTVCENEGSIFEYFSLVWVYHTVGLVVEGWGDGQGREEDDEMLVWFAVDWFLPFSVIFRFPFRVEITALK